MAQTARVHFFSRLGISMGRNAESVSSVTEHRREDPREEPGEHTGDDDEDHQLPHRDQVLAPRCEHQQHDECQAREEAGHAPFDHAFDLRKFVRPPTPCSQTADEKAAQETGDRKDDRGRCIPGEHRCFLIHGDIPVRGK
jgi:hypothetical protein